MMAARDSNSGPPMLSKPALFLPHSHDSHGTRPVREIQSIWQQVVSCGERIKFLQFDSSPFFYWSDLTLIPLFFVCLFTVKNAYI